MGMKKCTIDATIKIMKYAVTVKPNSKKGPLVIKNTNELTVYLREKPIDGKANAALINILSDYFKIAKTRIAIQNGAHGRKKTVEII